MFSKFVTTPRGYLYYDPGVINDATILEVSPGTKIVIRDRLYPVIHPVWRIGHYRHSRNDVLVFCHYHLWSISVKTKRDGDKVFETHMDKFADECNYNHYELIEKQSWK